MADQQQDGQIGLAERVVQIEVHRRRLADPGQEKYTNWWVEQVIDALRFLPVEQRMAAMGMEPYGLTAVTKRTTWMEATDG